MNERVTALLFGALIVILILGIASLSFSYEKARDQRILAAKSCAQAAMIANDYQGRAAFLCAVKQEVKIL